MLAHPQSLMASQNYLECSSDRDGTTANTKQHLLGRQSKKQTQRSPGASTEPKANNPPGPDSKNTGVAALWPTEQSLSSSLVELILTGLDACITRALEDMCKGLVVEAQDVAENRLSSHFCAMFRSIIGALPAVLLGAVEFEGVPVSSSDSKGIAAECGKGNMHGSSTSYLIAGKYDKTLPEAENRTTLKVVGCAAGVIVLLEQKLKRFSTDKLLSKLEQSLIRTLVLVVKLSQLSLIAQAETPKAGKGKTELSKTEQTELQILKRILNQRDTNNLEFQYPPQCSRKVLLQIGEDIESVVKSLKPSEKQVQKKSSFIQDAIEEAFMCVLSALGSGSSGPAGIAPPSQSRTFKEAMRQIFSDFGFKRAERILNSLEEKESAALVSLKLQEASTNVSPQLNANIASDSSPMSFSDRKQQILTSKSQPNVPALNQPQPNKSGTNSNLSLIGTDLLPLEGLSPTRAAIVEQSPAPATHVTLPNQSGNKSQNAANLAAEKSAPQDDFSSGLLPGESALEAGAATVLSFLSIPQAGNPNFASAPPQPDTPVFGQSLLPKGKARLQGAGDQVVNTHLDKTSAGDKAQLQMLNDELKKIEAPSNLRKMEVMFGNRFKEKMVDRQKREEEIKKRRLAAANRGADGVLGALEAESAGMGLLAAEAGLGKREEPFRPWGAPAARGFPAKGTGLPNVPVRGGLVGNRATNLVKMKKNQKNAKSNQVRSEWLEGIDDFKDSQLMMEDPPQLPFTELFNAQKVVESTSQIDQLKEQIKLKLNGRKKSESHEKEMGPTNQKHRKSNEKHHDQSLSPSNYGAKLFLDDSGYELSESVERDPFAELSVAEEKKAQLIELQEKEKKPVPFKPAKKVISSNKIFQTNDDEKSWDVSNLGSEEASVLIEDETATRPLHYWKKLSQGPLKSSRAGSHEPGSPLATRSKIDDELERTLAELDAPLQISVERAAKSAHSRNSPSTRIVFRAPDNPEPQFVEVPCVLSDNEEMFSIGKVGFVNGREARDSSP